MYQRIVRGISLSFVFILLGSLLGYFFRKLLTSSLSVADYGLFFSVVSFYSFFMLFIDLGLEQAATKQIVELRLQKQYDKIRVLSFSILFFQLSISALLYLFILLFADRIAISYFHSQAALVPLQLLGIWFVTTPLILFLASLLLGFQRTTWYTALDFFRMTFIVVVSGLLLFFGNGLLSPILAYTLVQLILFLFYLPYVLSFFPHLLSSRFFFDKQLLFSSLSYGVFIAFTNFGWILLTQTDTLFLTYFTSFEIVGLYNVALPLSLLLLFFLRPVTIVFSPLATELVAAKKHDALSQAITYSYQYLFILLLPCAAAFLLFPTFLISFLFDTAYISAAPALQILTIGTFFYAFSLFNGIIFTGLGKVKHMAFLVAGVAVLNALLNFILVPLYGMYGAAFSTTVSYLLLFFFSIILLRRILSFTFPLKTWGIAFVFGAFSSGLVYVVKNYLPYGFLVFVSSALLFAFCYFGLLFLCRVLTLQELVRFFRRQA